MSKRNRKRKDSNMPSNKQEQIIEGSNLIKETKSEEIFDEKRCNRKANLSMKKKILIFSSAAIFVALVLLNICLFNHFTSQISKVNEVVTVARDLRTNIDQDSANVFCIKSENNNTFYAYRILLIKRHGKVPDHDKNGQIKLDKSGNEILKDTLISQKSIVVAPKDTQSIKSDIADNSIVYCKSLSDTNYNIKKCCLDTVLYIGLLLDVLLIISMVVCICYVIMHRGHRYHSSHYRHSNVDNLEEELKNSLEEAQKEYERALEKLDDVQSEVFSVTQHIEKIGKQELPNDYDQSCVIYQAYADDIIKFISSLPQKIKEQVTTEYTLFQTKLEEYKASENQKENFPAYKDIYNKLVAKVEDVVPDEGFDISVPTENSDELDLLQEEVDKTLDEVNRLKDLLKSSEDSVDIDALNEQINSLKSENRSLLEDKNNFEKAIREAKEAANQRADKKIASAKIEAEKQISAAENRAAVAERKSEEIREEVTNQFKDKLADLNDTIAADEQKIGELRLNLSEVNRQLKDTTQNLESTEQTLQDKTNALASYRERIEDVVPAGDYAKKIEALLKTGIAIEKEADKILEKNIDTYLPLRYIARYNAALHEIDLTQFYTDVNNVANVQFVYKEQALAKYDQRNKKEFYESMKIFFFSTYLEKYVDALMVLNETFAGMYHIVEGLTASDVKQFSVFRDQLNKEADALELEVHSVKLFEGITDNVDLHAELRDLDFECPTGTICEIENCLVYLKGGNRPDKKINVIVKR